MMPGLVFGNECRIVVKVESMAMPIEPPRLRIMLKSADAEPDWLGGMSAVATLSNGTSSSGWPRARMILAKTNCGRA